MNEALGMALSIVEPALADWIVAVPGPIVGLDCPGSWSSAACMAQSG
jgi:hypothetical protein